MRLKISICLIISMLLSTIGVYATDEVYVWSNQAEVLTDATVVEQTGNFLRIRMWRSNINRTNYRKNFI